MNKTRLMPILIVIATGIVLGGLILMLDKSPGNSVETVSTDDNVKPGDTPSGVGPRGGKLFTDSDFSLELTIFEKGVPPQFRIN